MTTLGAICSQLGPVCICSVDNLKSGSGTTEVDKCECLLAFCTKAYFQKGNSMKELYRAVTNRRPILAMLEPDSTQDGGLDERDITKLLTDQYLDKFELRKKWEEWKKKGTVVADGYQDHAPTSEDVVRALFATSPVEWSRLPHFQDVTLRLIAQKGVLQGEGRAEQKLSLDGEVAMKTVALPEPLVS